MAQYLRACTPFSKDVRLIPSTHERSSQPLVPLSPGDLAPSFQLPRMTALMYGITKK